MPISIRQLRDLAADPDLQNQDGLKTILDDFDKTVAASNRQREETLKHIAFLIRKMDLLNSLYETNVPWETAASVNDKEVMIKLPLFGETISSIGLQLLDYLSCEQVLDLVTPYVRHTDVKDGRQFLVFNDGTIATVSRNENHIIDDLTLSQYSENDTYYRIRFTQTE